MKFLKNIYLVALLMISSAAFSQNQSLSLLQAQDLAANNSKTLKAHKVNEELALNSLGKIKNNWLPEINATGDVRYNTQLESMVLDGFGANGGAERIQIGTKTASVFSLDLSQPLYQPNANSDKKLAQTNALLEREKNVEKQNDIWKAIAESYLNVLLKEVQYQTALQAVNRNKNYVAVAQDRYKLRVLLENDLLKTKLDLKNAEQTATEQQHAYEWALMQLKYQLNIPYEDSLLLADNLETLTAGNAALSTNAYSNSAIKQLSLEKETLNLELAKNKNLWLPSVSFVANYTAQFQSSNYNYFSNNWSPYNYVGIKATLPIMANFKNSYKTQELQYKINQNAINAEIKQQELDHKIRQYTTDVINTENALKNSKENLEYAQTIYQSALQTFKLGTTTYTATLDSETSVQTAEQNYVKAVYNYLVAKLSLEEVKK